MPKALFEYYYVVLFHGCCMAAVAAGVRFFKSFISHTDISYTMSTTAALRSGTCNVVTSLTLGLINIRHQRR